MTAAEVLSSLFDEFEGEFWPSYRAEERARVTARLAQLEKVAELARRAVDPMGQGPRADRLALLHMALVDLDHHPDTRP